MYVDLFTLLLVQTFFLELSGAFKEIYSSYILHTTHFVHSMKQIGKCCMNLRRHTMVTIYPVVYIEITDCVLRSIMFHRVHYIMYYIIKLHTIILILHSQLFKNVQQTVE